MRTCNQCGKLKKETEFYKRQGSKCKECIKLYSREYKAKNKEKKKISDAKYYKKNKHIFIECNKRFAKNNPSYQKKYASTNRNRISKYIKTYANEAKNNLTDYYVNSVYRRVNNNNLKKALLPIKREQLRIKREIKKQEL